MAKFLTLVVFIIVVQVIGATIGLSFGVDAWYETINKPFFTPPGSLFGIVWPILYLLIAIAGWRAFTGEEQPRGWGLWVGQMVCNWCWSPLYFGAHQIFWAMILLGVTLLFSVSFAAVNWERDKLAAWCFVPYCVWLSFALLLNTTIWLMN